MLLYNNFSHIKSRLSPRENSIPQSITLIKKIVTSATEYLSGPLHPEKGNANQKKEYSQILRDQHVLVLEEDISIQSLLEYFLKLYGAKITLASTVQEATTKFSKLVEVQRDHAPLVITDGRIHGDHTKTIETMMFIKTISPETKILLFTGLYKEYILESVQEKDHNKIFDLYLQKPANMSLILEAIRNLAELHK